MKSMTATAWEQQARVGDSRPTMAAHRAPDATQLKNSKLRRLSKTELMLITTQLSIMMKAGMELADAVQQLALKAKSVSVRDRLLMVHQDLQEGQSFSNSLKRQESAFGAGYVASVSAGEASGRLGDVMGRLRELLRNDLRIRSALKGSLTYPAVLLLVSSFVVAALVFFVLPQFDKVFTNLDAPVPSITRVLLAIGKFSRNYLWLELIGLALFGVLAFKSLSLPQVRLLCDRLLLETKWLRDGYRDLQTGRTFSMIGTMLQSGVPLLETIRICRDTVSNAIFRRLFDDVEDAILAGGSIAPAIHQSPSIPDGAAEMVATAERSGELGAVFELVGAFYEEEGERKLREQVKLVEPIIIVIMGGLVAVIVASVMLPLFDLSSSSTH